MIACFILITFLDEGRRQRLFFSVKVICQWKVVFFNSAVVFNKAQKVCHLWDVFQFTPVSPDIGVRNVLLLILRNLG